MVRVCMCEYENVKSQQDVELPSIARRSSKKWRWFRRSRSFETSEFKHRRWRWLTLLFHLICCLLILHQKTRLHLRHDRPRIDFQPGRAGAVACGRDTRKLQRRWLLSIQERGKQRQIDEQCSRAVKSLDAVVLEPSPEVLDLPLLSLCGRTYCEYIDNTTRYKKCACIGEFPITYTAYGGIALVL